MASYNSIKEASDAYFAAKKRGDAAGMQAANNAANEIRKSQGQKPQYATQDINNTRKSMGGLIGSLGNAMGNIGNAITGGSRPSGGGSSGGGSSGGSYRPAGSGSSGGSGNVGVTLPNGQTTSSRYENGKVTGNLPVGSIIHTAGGDYQITGGTAGNYTSERYNGGVSTSRPSSGGSSGGSGNISVTLPNGQTTSSGYQNGKVTGNLPIGSIVHTAGGDYIITGGTPGNYTSTKYNGSAVNPGQAIDYSDMLNDAINRGASWEEVQSILDLRNQKINADASLSKYLYDENYARAMQYIYAKQQNEAQLAANLANLEGAYNQSLASFEASKNQIAPVYQAERNQTAASSDVNWSQFNEVAAANGLNTGALGQVALSRSVALQNDLNELNRDEAQELSKIDMEIAKLTAEYNSAVAQAKAAGDAELAAALYQQFNNYIAQKQEQRNAAAALQQAQAEAEQARRDEAYNLVLDLITSGILPTDKQLAAAGMTQEDARYLYAQVMSDKLSGGRSGGSGGRKSSGGGGNISTEDEVEITSKDSGNHLTTAQIRAVQKSLGVAVDGIWGPATAAAAKKAGYANADAAWKANENRVDTSKGEILDKKTGKNLDSDDLVNMKSSKTVSIPTIVKGVKTGIADVTWENLLKKMERGEITAIPQANGKYLLVYEIKTK